MISPDSLYLRIYSLMTQIIFVIEHWADVHDEIIDIYSSVGISLSRPFRQSSFEEYTVMHQSRTPPVSAADMPIVITLSHYRFFVYLFYATYAHFLRNMSLLSAKHLLAALSLI
jgi:hypothetical protein